MDNKALAAFKRLLDASGEMYRLALHRDTYGDTYLIVGKTKEQAFDDALLELSAAITTANSVYHKELHRGG